MRLRLDGEAIVALRKARALESGKPRDWTTEAVAHRAQVSEKTVRNVEKGRHRSNPAQAEGLRRALRVPVAEWPVFILEQFI